MTTHLGRPLGQVCGLQFGILRLRPCSTLAEMTGFPLLFFADPDNDFGPCDWLIGMKSRNESTRQKVAVFRPIVFLKARLLKCLAVGARPGSCLCPSDLSSFASFPFAVAIMNR